jgi:histone-lysine N-methyltransferase SETD3
MATFLLEEKQNPDSKFKDYIDTLPSSMKDFPIFFSDAEMHFLKGSPIVHQIKKRQKNIQKDFDLLCDKIPDFKNKNFTLE